ERRRRRVALGAAVADEDRGRTSVQGVLTLDREGAAAALHERDVASGEALEVFGLTAAGRAGRLFRLAGDRRARGGGLTEHRAGASGEAVEVFGLTAGGRAGRIFELEVDRGDRGGGVTEQRVGDRAGVVTLDLVHDRIGRHALEHRERWDRPHVGGAEVDAVA